MIPLTTTGKKSLNLEIILWAKLKKSIFLESAWRSKIKKTLPLTFFWKNNREKKDLKDFAISKFAKDLLDVIDNLERAIETSTKEYEGKNNDLFEG